MWAIKSGYGVKKEYSLVYEGYRYYYRITSNPDAVLSPIYFISGAFQNMDSWNRFNAYFNQFAEIIVADLPGFGKADLLPESYGLQFYTEAVKRIFDHAGIEKVNLVGASYGSPVAYTFAQKYPERVERLAMSGIMKNIPDNVRPSIELSLQQIKDRQLEEFIDTAVENLCSKSNSTGKLHQKLSERMLRKQLRELTSDDLERYVTNTLRLLNHPPLDIHKSPTIPAVIFTGEQDRFTLPEYCMEIASAISDSRFLTVDEGDHLFHMKYFDTTVKILERFMFNLPLDCIPGSKFRLCSFVDKGVKNADCKRRETMPVLK